MKILIAFIITFAATGRSWRAIPAEWQAAAQVVIGELERDSPDGVKAVDWQRAHAGLAPGAPGASTTTAMSRSSWPEYLTFVAPCRRGCAGNTIEGQGYIAVAEQVKALRNQQGGPYALAANAHAWLAALPDPTGAARKNADLWAKDPDVAAADFATGNLYALAWLLARNRPTPAEQATHRQFAIFVQGKAGSARVASIFQGRGRVDAPPRIECK
jgi:hypothetical protein